MSVRRSIDPADLFNLVVPGQFSNDWMHKQLNDKGTNHDSIGWAPYFGSIEAHKTDAEVYLPLFANPWYNATVGRMKAVSKLVSDHNPKVRRSIYESNYGTGGGKAPVELPDQFLTGQAGALALPLHMLTCQRENKLETQCAFTFYGVCYRINNKGGGFSAKNWQCARVWGLVRNLHSNPRKRPTGFGLELINKVSGGDVIRTAHSGDDPSWTQPAINGINEPVDVKKVQSFAFKSGKTRGLVLLNLDLVDSHECCAAVRWHGAASVHRSVRVHAYEVSVRHCRSIQH